RRLVIELVACLVGRQLLAVQAIVASPANYGCFALEEFHPGHAAHETLIAEDESEQVLVKSTEPESIIDDICIFLSHDCPEALRRLAEHKRFQLAVGLVQNDRGRRLVQLA